MPENFYHNDWPYGDGSWPASRPLASRVEDPSLADYDQLDFALATGVIAIVKPVLDSDWDFATAT